MVTIQKGETILSESPFAFVLKSSLKNEKCDYCFSNNDLKKCSRCNYVQYCGTNCQKSAWAIHKLECANLKQVLPKTLPDSAHLLIRIILALKLKKKYQLCSQKIGDLSRSLQDLKSHRDEIQKDRRRMDHFEMTLFILRSFFKDSETIDDAFILELFGKMCINSFNILDNDMNSIGTGIYLNASILDHSCQPNAVAVFHGTTIQIRTITCIANFLWKTVRIAYIDVLNFTEERQNELQSLYYFLCDCRKCSDETNNELMNSVQCQNSECLKPVPMKMDEKNAIVCQECRVQVSEKVIRSYCEIVQLSDYHLQNMKSKNMNYLDVCEMILEKQQHIFHNLNIRKVKILDHAFEACINLKKWSAAMSSGLQLLPGFKKYYGLYHPLVGLLYLKLLKLSVFLKNDIREAQIFYGEAFQILSVTHGNKHPLFESMQALVSR